MNDATKPDVRQAFFQRARKGVLKFVLDKGGKASLGEMHQHSESKFFIAHQNFSKMMESFVDEKLVDFDQASQIATLTEAGKTFATTLN